MYNAPLANGNFCPTRRRIEQASDLVQSDPQLACIFL